MKGRWRLFRHEAGRVAGPAPWAYVLLFALAQIIGFWSVSTFGAVTVWLSNGIMAAALLQLHRRPAMLVVTACFTLNLLFNMVRGDPGVFLWVNAVLNLAEAWIVAMLARRFCGAALDMRRPQRLLRFAALCTVAVAVVAAAGFGLLWLVRHPPLPILLFKFQSFFIVELMGLLLITPVLLSLARAHRFCGMARASAWEAGGWLVAMIAVTIGVFWYDRAPLLFLPILPMLLISLRLSPTTAAIALMIHAGLSGLATLTGHGPVHLFDPLEVAGLEAVPTMLRRLGIYNIYMLSVVATVLPLSTMMSERRRLETQLRASTEVAREARRRAETAAAARSRFLAVMSHEMRTPLNGVAGFADLLAARPGLDAEGVRQALQIRESSDGLLILVEDILDFASGDDALSPEPLDLVSVVREAVLPSRAAADGKRLALSIDDRLPSRARFLCDRRALRQAIHPLVSNAVKFTDKGAVRVRLDRAGDGVVIRVSDTGEGIPDAVLPELFEAFAQGDCTISRRHSGAGIGLALVARQVSRLGGRIDVESQPGQGTTFTLNLPLMRVADAEPEAPVAIDLPPPVPPPLPELPDVEDAPVRRAPRVLVADDHPVNREVARIMLQAFGCEVTEACDGAEAVAAVEAEVFDLVLMDVRMPVMDGLEATRRIRDLPNAADVAIVAMTADAMPEDVVRCLTAGMNAHLAKPINQAALLDAVGRALSGDLPQARVSRAA